MAATKYPHRVTLDFRDESEVFEELKRRAKTERRSLSRQLLHECLPGLRKNRRNKKGLN